MKPAQSAPDRRKSMQAQLQKPNATVECLRCPPEDNIKPAAGAVKWHGWHICADCSVALRKLA